MQFFFVKQNVLLKLPHKQKQLVGVTRAQLERRQVPLDKIYCGVVAWEYRQAKQLIGQDNAFEIASTSIGAELLPHRLTPYASGVDLIVQLRTLVEKRQALGLSQSLRIALINGTGTMLGDTLIGSSVLENILEYLKTEGFVLEVDVYAAWNARPGVEDLWKKNPLVRAVFDSSPNIKTLQAYHAYWDYSELLRMAGYESQHFGDFYLHSFGMDPNAFSVQAKLPSIQIDKVVSNEIKTYLAKESQGLPTVFVQAQASTPARSIPEGVLVPLLKSLVKERLVKVVISSPYPKGLTNFERGKILNTSVLTENNLERYFALVTLSHYVITVDTLALHLAMGAGVAGLSLFSISDPAIRLKYSPQIKGLLIPNARALPYWNKHKHDDQWVNHQTQYEKAWEELNLVDLVKKDLSRHLTFSS